MEALVISYREHKELRQAILVNDADGKVRWALGIDPAAATSDHEGARTIIVFSTISTKLVSALGKPATTVEWFNEFRDQNEGLILAREQLSA